MKMPRGDGYRPPHVALSFMRMSVSIRGMFVSELAMFQSCSCVLLGICMLTERVMVLCLMMMMRGGMVVSRPPGDDAHPLDVSVTVPFGRALLRVNG